MSRFSRAITGFPVFSRIDNWLGKFLTPLGKALFLTTGLFLVGSIHLDTPVYLLCGAGGSLLLIALLGVRFFRPSLRLGCATAGVVTVAEPFRLWVEACNQGQRTVRNVEVNPVISANQTSQLRIAAEGAFIEKMEPGKTASANIGIEATRRGVFSMPDLETKTSFPLNLIFVAETHVVPGEILAAPACVPLASLDSIVDSQGLLIGEQATMQTEGIEEFIGSREYVPGMATRRWDHRTWARLGSPHVCQFEKESSARLSLLLDLSQSESGAIREAAITLLLSIATELSDRNITIGSLTVGKNRIQLAGDSISRLSTIAVALARIDFDRESDVGVPAPQRDQGLSFIQVAAVDAANRFEANSIVSAPNWVNILVVESEQAQVSAFQVTVSDIERGKVVL